MDPREISGKTNKQRRKRVGNVTWATINAEGHAEAAVEDTASIFFEIFENVGNIIVVRKVFAHYAYQTERRHHRQRYSGHLRSICDVCQWFNPNARQTGPRTR